MKKENLLKGIIVIFGTSLSYLKYNNLKFLNFEYLGVFMIAIILIFIIAIIALNKNIYKLKWVVINPKLALLFFKFKSSQLKINLNSVISGVKPKIKTDSKRPLKINKLNFIEIIILLLVAIGFGIIVGFYLKEPNEFMFETMLEQPSEWKKELVLESIRSRAAFFELSTALPFMGPDGKNLCCTSFGDFKFNWLAFFTCVISVLLFYFLITKTTIKNLLKSMINTYLI